MTEEVNPLLTLGVPVWFIEEQLRRGEDNPRAGVDGLKAIQDLAITVYKRMVLRLYHSDSGATPNDATYKMLTGLHAILSDLDVVDAYARDLVETGGPDKVSMGEYAARDAARVRRRLDALIGMLVLVDPWELLGIDRPQQLVFGLSEDATDNLFDAYAQTFMLDVRRESQALALSAHALDGMGGSAHFSYTDQLSYQDGHWQLEYYDTILGPVGTDEVTPVTRRHIHANPVSLGEVRLVGGVSPSPLIREPSTLFSVPTTRAIEGGNGPRAAGVTWLPAAHAEWLRGIKPELGMGDFGVIATGKGDNLRLALVGRLIARRPLDP